LNELRTSLGNFSAGTREEHNIVRVTRERFRYAIIVVFSRRIKPNGCFKVRRGLTWPQLCHQVAGRRHNGSFSFRFSKLTLNFLTAHADDKESAIWELSRDNANQIGISGMERRRQHRGHYIG
jgi:hypothetical protein